jgi:hypothetical protein
MRESFSFGARTLVGLILVWVGVAAAAEKPLDWLELMTVGQQQPKTDLQWRTDEAQVLALHPQLTQPDWPMPTRQGFFLAGSAPGDGCPFLTTVGSSDSHALDWMMLRLAPGAPETCREKWQAAMQSLYGKPISSGPVQDLVVDANTAIQTFWATQTSCITLSYTRADAARPAPFTITFGDKRTLACGYDDEVIAIGPTPAR